MGCSFTLLAALCVSSGALAVPAFPGLIPIQDEAAGETISGYLCGDEFFSYRTDAEGRVIVADEAGCLRYVIRDGGRYALGGYLIAKNGDTAISGTPVMEGDEGLESRLRVLEKEIEASRPIPLTGEGESSPFSPLVGRYDYNKAENNDALCGKMARYSAYPTPEDYVKRGGRGSTIPLLLIRVNYSDVQCCFTEEQWSRQIFDESKGIPAFYRENSNGAFAYRNTDGHYGVMPLHFYDDPQLLAEQYPELVHAGQQRGISPLLASGSEALRTKRGSSFLKPGMRSGTGWPGLATMCRRATLRSTRPAITGPTTSTRGLSLRTSAPARLKSTSRRTALPGTSRRWFPPSIPRGIHPGTRCWCPRMERAGISTA